MVGGAVLSLSPNRTLPPTVEKSSSAPALESSGARDDPKKKQRAAIPAGVQGGSSRQTFGTSRLLLPSLHVTQHNPVSLPWT